MQRPSLHTHNSFSPTASCLLTTEAHKHRFTLDLNFTCEDLHIPTCTLKFRCDPSYFSGRCMALQSPAQRPRLWILLSKDFYFFDQIQQSSYQPDQTERAHTHCIAGHFTAERKILESMMPFSDAVLLWPKPVFLETEQGSMLNSQYFYGPSGYVTCSNLL